MGEKVKALYERLPPDQKYIIADTTSAELAKYMSNLVLVIEVLLANDFMIFQKSRRKLRRCPKNLIRLIPELEPTLKVPGPDGDRGFGERASRKIRSEFWDWRKRLEWT